MLTVENAERNADTSARRASGGAPPPTGRPGGTSGRGRELAALARILDTPDPSVRLVEISGDPWIGKSRLLEELGDLARERGWTVAPGAAGPLPATLPFGVFTDALHDLLAPGGEALLDGFPPHHVSWLAGIFPTLTRHAPDLALPENPSEMHHVFHAIRALLDNLGAANRLLLIADDLHWADEASIALVAYLLRHPPAERVLLVAARRPRQTGESLHAVLDGAVTTGQSTRIDLPPLSDDAITALLPDLEPHRLHALREAAGGSPGLFLALAALEEGPPEPAAGGPRPATEIWLSPLREFRGLSPLGWTIAHSAALVREPFDIELLETVAQVGEAEVRASVDELVRHDILRLDETERTFRFRNRLLRRTAYEAAGAAWRLGAHTRAAAVLRDREAPLPQIALHLGHSVVTGEDAESGGILTEAARAVLWEDPEQAAAWTRAALEMRPRGDDGRPDSAEQRLLLATALALTGRLQESLAIFEHTASRASGGPGEPRIWHAQVLRLLGRHAEAVALLEQAITALPPGAVRDRARWTGTLLATSFETGRTPRAPDGVDHARLADDPVLHSLLLALRALGHGDQRDGTDLADDRVRHVRAAAELVDGLPDTALLPLLDALYWLGRAETEAGLDEEALAHLERALRLATAHRHRYIEPQLATLLAHVRLRLCDIEGACLRADHARGVARHIGSESQLAQALGLCRRIDRLAALGHSPDDPSAPPPQETGTGPAADEAGIVPLPEIMTELNRLSGREREIAVLVSDGRTNQQIARVLGLSPKTVETYLARIFKKLTLCSRAQLAAIVGRSGTVAPVPEQAT
ncbi:AAA family ATPase [Actinomadura sp. GTD37]|uniref:helix-turn-helix transcriptional regulator n=1 Tax=Actinomadura sp. GTD37 TaxID=1778030 RepID=UPI0035BEE189